MKRTIFCAIYWVSREPVPSRNFKATEERKFLFVDETKRFPKVDFSFVRKKGDKNKKRYSNGIQKRSKTSDGEREKREGSKERDCTHTYLRKREHVRRRDCTAGIMDVLHGRGFRETRTAWMGRTARRMDGRTNEWETVTPNCPSLYGGQVR